MAQWVEYLIHKHENMRLGVQHPHRKLGFTVHARDPSHASQHPHRKLGFTVHVCDPSPACQRQEDPEGS